MFMKRLTALLALFVLVSEVGFAAGTTVIDTGKSDLKTSNTFISVYPNAPQTIASNTNVIAVMNVEEEDICGEFAANAFTPQETAWYDIDCTIGAVNLEDGTLFQMGIWSGSTNLRKHYANFNPSAYSASGLIIYAAHWHVKLTAGTAYSISLFQSGTVNVVTSEPYGHLTIRRAYH